MKGRLNKSTTIMMIVVLFVALQVSCKVAAQSKKLQRTEHNNFLQGYWNYANGAQAYYDGVGDSAIGTKAPTNNCYHFVVGENYWENLKQTGNNTWSVSQIVRYCPTGARVFEPTIFTKVNDSTIRLQNSLLGTEYLIRHFNNE